MPQRPITAGLLAVALIMPDLMMSRMVDMRLRTPSLTQAIEEIWEFLENSSYLSRWGPLSGTQWP